MNLYLSISLIIALLILSVYMYKDLMSPAIVMLIPWGIAFFLLGYSNFYYSFESVAYTYIIVGLILFQIFYGVTYAITSKKRYRKKKVINLERYESLVLSELKLYGILFFQIVVLIYYEIVLLGGSEPILLFEYIHKMVFALFYLLILHYCTCGANEKKRAKKFLILQFVPLIISLILPTNGRASYFLFLIGAVFIYLSFHAYDNKLIFKRLLGILLILVAIFTFVAIRKEHISSNAQGLDLITQSFDWIIHYFSGSLVTFQHWLGDWNEYFDFGKNTFRIFYAFGNKFLDSSIEVSSTFFPFMKIGPNSESIANVYTIYYTYIIDFGILGGLLIQCFLGWFYAKLYLLKDSQRIGNVYAFAIFIYPLLMQSFGDQYVAIFSYFLQMYLWYFIFHRCQFLYKTKNSKITILKN